MRTSCFYVSTKACSGGGFASHTLFLHVCVCVCHIQMPQLESSNVIPGFIRGSYELLWSTSRPYNRGLCPKTHMTSWRITIFNGNFDRWRSLAVDLCHLGPNVSWQRNGPVFLLKRTSRHQGLQKGMYFVW